MAICLVMVFSIFSGSLAYSGFSGTATTNVSATANFIGISEGICFVSYWSDNTAIAVQGHSYPGNSCGFTEFCPPLNIVKSSTSYTGVLEDYLNISNLAPGNAVLFEINLHNPNNLGCLIQSVSLGNFSAQGLVMENESIENNLGYVFSIVNSTLEQTNRAGGFYGFAVENSMVISPGSTLPVWFYLILSRFSGNDYQEAHFTLPIVITISENQFS
ncbi:MAG: hypothetical protein M1431_01075 [Candidatus Thermoplasmatota archaeon]|nr:hypothetical protein [Candidatus Thermoplasmatota archaeon]